MVTRLIKSTNATLATTVVYVDVPFGTVAACWPSEGEPGIRLIATDTWEPGIGVIVTATWEPGDDVKSTRDAKFNELTSQWIRDTGHLSTTKAMEDHPSFEALKEMGFSIFELILEKLRDEPGARWFALLRAIYGTSPIPPADRGNISRMASAWLQWQSHHAEYDVELFRPS